MTDEGDRGSFGVAGSRIGGAGCCSSLHPLFNITITRHVAARRLPILRMCASYVQGDHCIGRWSLYARFESGPKKHIHEIESDGLGSDVSPAAVFRTLSEDFHNSAHRRFFRFLIFAQRCDRPAC